MPSGRKERGVSSRSPSTDPNIRSRCGANPASPLSAQTDLARARSNGIFELASNLMPMASPAVGGCWEGACKSPRAEKVGDKSCTCWSVVMFSD